MRKYLAFVAFLILPLAFGYVLHEQLLDWEKYSQWVGATGVIALALLSLAAISRELCRVVLWLPREETVARVSLLGTYLFAAPHVGLFLATLYAGEMGFEFLHSAWFFATALGTLALLLLIAVPLRRLLLRSALAIPRWSVLVAAGMALLHGRLLGLVVGQADENARWFSNQLASRNGHYAIPIFLCIWIVLALFTRYQVRFTSPIPHFSLLTLLLIPCAGFSGIVLHKHWMPWSVERTLAQAEEITNPWGSFKYPAAALSPEGAQAFSAIPEGPALLWNCNAGTSQELHAHIGEALDARYSPDGSKLAVITRADGLFQSSIDGGPMLLKRVFESDSVRGDDMTEDVKALLEKGEALLANCSILWIYDSATLQIIARVPVAAFESSLNSDFDFSFSADSKRLLSLSNYQGAYLWEIATGKLLAHRFLTWVDRENNDRERVLTVKSAKGWRLILEKPDLRFGEFSIQSPALPVIWERLRRFEKLPDLCLSEDGTVLILAHQPLDVEALNVKDGSTRWRTTLEKREHVAQSHLSAFCFDSERVLTLVDSQYELLSLADGKSLAKSRSGGSTMDRARLHNAPLFSFGESERYVLNPATLEGSLIFEKEEGQQFSLFSAIGRTALSADRNWLMDCGSMGSVRVWKNRHPPQWWGVAVLPEFWLTLLFSGALLWSIVRDRRLNVATASGAPARV